jgi:23S rRNA (cytidine2498-2'-O)-methyltransferase
MEGARRRPLMPSSPKTSASARPGPRSEYIFAVCRAGSEPAMKRQVIARAGRMLSPSFMRPQLVTWKSSRLLDPSFALDSVFARVSGISLGMFSDDASLAEKVAGAFPGLTLQLHVFPRIVPEDGVPEDAWRRLDAKRKELVAALEAAGVKLSRASRPGEGQFVIDVIVGEPGEKLFLGAHVHGPERHPQAGALPRLALPEDAPSRAYLKMEQALIWAGLDGPKALPGKTALELGCAPGGATLALLRHGMNVVGVDTADLDPRVVAEGAKRPGSLRQLRVAASDLFQEELPRPVHVLVSDMNIAPPIMLRTIERVQSRVRARVLILTLKLNDRFIEEQIPRFLKQIEIFAPFPVRATQLPANRAEFCVVAGEFMHRRATV